MRIYFNGDSNTAATELPDLTCGYAHKLCQKLGASTVENDAWPGCSNMRIIRTTEDFLHRSAQARSYPDLIVIGWSSFEREEWWSDDYGTTISLNTHIFDQESVRQTPRYQYWYHHQAMDSHYSIQMAKFYNTQIYNLHLRMMSMGIHHVFFPAIHSLSYWEGQINHKDFAKVYRLDWHDCFIRPYDEHFSMVRHLADNGFEEITPGQAHYPEPAQQVWADYIANWMMGHERFQQLISI